MGLPGDFNIKMIFKTFLIITRFMRLCFFGIILHKYLLFKNFIYIFTTLMTFRLTHYWNYYKDKMTTDTVIRNNYFLNV